MMNKSEIESMVDRRAKNSAGIASERAAFLSPDLAERETELGALRPVADAFVNLAEVVRSDEGPGRERLTALWSALGPFFGVVVEGESEGIERRPGREAELVESLLILEESARRARLDLEEKASRAEKEGER